MSKYLEIAKRKIEMGYLTDRKVQTIVALALVSIAESLECLLELLEERNVGQTP